MGRGICSATWRTSEALLKALISANYLGFSRERMVLLERFELSASPLPRECSTPEL